MKALAQAKLAVMRAVTHTEKDGEMKGRFTYRYRSIEAILAQLRPAMVEAGLVVSMPRNELLDRTPIATQNGGSFQSATVLATFALTHAESGEREEGQAIGKGTDSLDKELNKALTAAEKQFLLKTFLLDTEDDPDHESSERQAPRAAKVEESHSNGKQTGPAKLTADQQAKLQVFRDKFMPAINSARERFPLPAVLADIKEAFDDAGLEPQQRRIQAVPYLETYYLRCIALADTIEAGPALAKELREGTVEVGGRAIAIASLLTKDVMENLLTAIETQQKKIEAEVKRSVFA